jgi:NAD(P)-dependent dehydrogenase (short-subunit alcohol dehydrogenase family)
MRASKSSSTISASSNPNPREIRRDWRRFFDVNVLSGRGRAPGAARHAANWGRLIFISSESGAQIPAEMVHYGMTKSAQISIARGTESVAGTGITVNSVLPGPTRSRGVATATHSLRSKATGAGSR